MPLGVRHSFLCVFFFCTPFTIVQKWPLLFVLREYIILYNPKTILNGYTLDVQEVFFLMQRNMLLSHVKKHSMALLPKERSCELQKVRRIFLESIGCWSGRME